jgi:hypothetical protein
MRVLRRVYVSQSLKLLEAKHGGELEDLEAHEP